MQFLASFDLPRIPIEVDQKLAAEHRRAIGKNKKRTPGVSIYGINDRREVLRMTVAPKTQKVPVTPSMAISLHGHFHMTSRLRIACASAVSRCGSPSALST